MWYAEKNKNKYKKKVVMWYDITLINNYVLSLIIVFDWFLFWLNSGVWVVERKLDICKKISAGYM